MIHRNSRVINVSSMMQSSGFIDMEDVGAIKTPYSAMGAYSNSKLANVLFTKWIDHHYQTKGIKSVALHPGVVRTDIVNNFLDNPVK